MKRTITIILAAMIACSASFAAFASDVTEVSSVTDKKPSKKKKAELKEVTFLVHLHCESCMNKVQENIAFEKGVKDLKVSLEDQTVYVKYDAAKTSEETLKAAIEKLGYPVSGKIEPGHEHHGHEHHGHDHHHHDHGHSH